MKVAWLITLFYGREDFSTRSLLIRDDLKVDHQLTIGQHHLPKLLVKLRQVCCQCIAAEKLRAQSDHRSASSSWSSL